ncbi:MAG: hypothetical protein JSU01_01820, partial [Bacteroidetes bacterium]|nr:hypothetical protein [Bacteroidota bacterium]
CINTKNYRDAINLFKRAIAYLPDSSSELDDNTSDILLLGDSYVLNGDIDAGVNEYQKVKNKPILDDNLKTVPASTYIERFINSLSAQDLSEENRKKILDILKVK